MKKKIINLKDKIYNHLMINGKKHICEKRIFKTLKFLQKKNKKNNIEIIKMALINLAPIIQLRQIKKKNRKTVTEFPYVLNQKNRISSGIKSITSLLNTNSSHEILVIAKKKHELLKTRETKHKQALTKKKYAFFRWFF
jgi:ribosomal protein S7